MQATTDKTSYQSHDTIRISVKVKNSGKLAGKEVVQIYIHDVVSTVMTPVKQLKGLKDRTTTRRGKAGAAKSTCT